MKEISKIYHDIYPTLENMETQRVKVLRQGQNIFFIALGIVGSMGVFGVLMLQRQGVFPIPLIVLMVITAFVCGGIYFYKRAKVVKAFKSEVITRIIQSIDDNYYYNPVGHIDESHFNASKLFRSPDRYNGEDYISGRLDKTDFELSEVHAEYESRDSDGDRTYHTIFSGLLMIADFHKNFHGHTVVVPDRTGEGWFGRIAKSSKKRGMQLAKMENPIFEKLFDVYTTDQVEARYILSTSMLENITNLKKRFDADVHVAFLHSCVYIAIAWRKKFLEPNLKNSLLDESTIHQYLDDIWLCLEIIEELNLNTRIWSKS